MSDDKWMNVVVAAENSETGEEVQFANVLPLFGRPHTLLPSCWCNPEHDPDNWFILIHNHGFKQAHEYPNLKTPDDYAKFYRGETTDEN